MDKTGTIEIKITGQIGSIELKPDNYDIKQLAGMLQNIEDLLYPGQKNDRPLITYNVQEGSVRHIFKTPIQYIIGFSAVLSQINEINSIDFLDLRSAKAIENLQQIAFQKNYEFLISTSVNNEITLCIHSGTQFIRTENKWVDAEFYFYGILKDAGGKGKANIHIDTQEYGYLGIETDQNFLMSQETNLLYKKFGVRATGKQNIDSGEIDTKTLKLIELIDYHPRYDAEYLASLISYSKNTWQGVDPETWLSEIRGGYEG
ncbi:MAG TPA: hypothetical protein PLQ57_16520 [Saprospiraceae bacterium]|nr:hypothetical protein [Saprospiraceae bacterium]HRG66421.1 hypothetical protein [Saprospiraceae bacterium]